MDEVLKKIVSEDTEMKKLFAELYVDMGAEKACNDLQITEENKKSIIPIPVKDQITEIIKNLAWRNINIAEEEVIKFAKEFGRENFNFLK
ncbi:MAG TPA: hypothetical protein P5230_01565 [Candidatus Magasanikbacteria bacterium]|nr:hypothetical protein [Candidatus Magasanikbacteria bacterium]